MHMDILYIICGILCTQCDYLASMFNRNYILARIPFHSIVNKEI